MRGKRLIRLLKTVELLSSPSGVTLNRLSNELGLSDRKAAYRAIETVENLGFPVYDTPSPEGKSKSWKLEKSYLKKLPNISVPDFTFTLPDIIGLYFLRAQADIYRGTTYQKRLNQIFSRLNAFMPEGFEDKLHRINSLFVPSNNNTKDYSGKEDVIDSLANAILLCTTCSIDYHSFSKEKSVSFRIDPLHIFEHSGGLYVFYRSTDYGDIRILAVERINKITSNALTFDPPSDFDPHQHLAGAFDLNTNDPISATILISKKQAKYVQERKFFQNQTIQENDDGSIIIQLKTSGRWDVLRWVLSMGDEAQIIEPKDLRQEVYNILLNTIEKYSSP